MSAKKELHSQDVLAELGILRLFKLPSWSLETKYEPLYTYMHIYSIFVHVCLNIVSKKVRTVTPCELLSSKL